MLNMVHIYRFLRNKDSTLTILIAILIQLSNAAVVKNITGEAIITNLPLSAGSTVYLGGVKQSHNDSDSNVPPQAAILLDDETAGGAGLNGDIIEIPFEGNPTNSTSRKKRKLDGDRWPNGEVPYEFSTTHQYTEPYKVKIREAMKWWTDTTCIRFRESTSAPVRLSISNMHGCSSYVGYQPKVKESNRGLQLIKLGQNSCFSTVGTVAHELGHSLGLIHEQSRPDRDRHIDIHVDKIHGDSIHNFQTYYDAEIPQGVRYDLNSIMHYSPKSFALYANKPTMTAKNSNKDILMGQRSALSYYDIMAVNKEYCQGNCVDQCLNEGYVVYKDSRCRCVCPEGLRGSSCEQVDSSCGGVINLNANQEKTIKTPNYPRDYSNQKCVWLINAPAGYLLEIFFETFEVTNADGFCPHNVEIRNNILGQRGDIICGNGAIGPFDTRLDHQNNQMMITFDGTNRTVASGKGFLAKVKAFRDGCLSSPCNNGGTCVPSGSVSFTCVCEVGYIGATCEKANDAAVNCDFANNLCMFKNDDSDDLDMRRMFISTKYMETVKRDHNSNRFFVAAPAEFQTGLGDEARLISPVFSNNEVEKRCLRFSYHMSGAYQSHGQLRVTAKSVHGNSELTVLEKNGDQRLGWKNAVAEINKPGDYQVVFVIRASTIYPYNSLIAIDDITIEPHSCSGGPCANNPCSSSGGTCVEPKTGGYYCLCPPGTSGTLCDSYDIDGFTCNFDTEDHCGWTNANTDNYDWIKQYGAADAQQRTGPLSGADGAGSYMLADTSSSQAGVGRTAQLVSPNLNTNGQLCVEFNYHMWGSSRASLRLKAKTRRSSNTYHTLTGSQSSNINDWRVAQVTVTSTLDTQLVFEAVSGERHRSDIAIDKVKVTRGACGTSQTTSRTVTTPRPRERSTSAQSSRRLAAATVSAPSLSIRLRNSQSSRTTPSTNSNNAISRRIGESGPNLVACDFETDCSDDFINIASNSNKLWIRQEGSTPSTNTGPSFAYQGRYYMYTEASDLQVDETNSLSTHLLYNSDHEACISFYYSMHGAGMGTLRVLLKPEYGSTEEVWVRTGDQGPSWRRAEIDVDMNGNFYQIMFNATRGSSYQSDVAIDDIQIKRHTCGRRQRQATSSASSGQSRINIVCDFEANHFCSPSIQQSTDDDFDWVVNSGTTPTAGTGPDRAAGGQKYIMIEASSRPRGGKAKLETAAIPASSGEVCLKMNYHMKGTGVGNFNVYQKYSNGQTRTIFTKSGDQGSDWKDMQIEIQNDNSLYTVEIEAQLSHSDLRYSGDISVDNVSLVSGSC